MKYLIRSLKHLAQFAIMLTLFITIAVLTMDGFSFDKVFHPTEGMFRTGSLPLMIAFFVLVAAVYPAVTYVKKESFITGTFQEQRSKIVKTFELRGYEISAEDGETITFLLKKPFLRFMRMYEDAITLTKGESPLILSGPRKDIYRIASALEFATKNNEE